MLPYWLLLAVWMAGTLQYSRHGAAMGARVLFVVALIFTAGIIGFRFHVGGDWRAYQDMMVAANLLDFGPMLRVGDPGYTAISWMAARLGFGIVTVNVICGAIIAWGLGRFALRQPNPWLTVLVAIPYFVIVVAMGYTRQATAIGIIMAGLTGIRPQSLARLVMYVFVAASFHKTAVLLLPIIAIAAFRRNLIAGVGGALVFIAFYYVFLNSTADQLVANYASGDYDSQGAAIRVAMDVGAAIILFTFRDRMGFDNFERAIWMTFSAFAIACIPALVLISASSGVDRLALFLIPMQLVAFGRLPYAVSGKPQPNAPAFAMVLVYCAAVQFTWLNYAVNANYWIPYRFALTDLGETDEDL